MFCHLCINKHQYTDALNIRINIAIELEHSSNRSVKQKLYTEIFRCLFEDIDYLKHRAESINKEYSNTITYKSSYELYKDGDRKIKIKTDKPTKTVSLNNQNLQLFIHSTLWYAYEYKETELFDDVYELAKQNIDNKTYFDLWELFLFADKTNQDIDFITSKIKNMKIDFCDCESNEKEIILNNKILSLWLLLDFYSIYSSKEI